MSIKYIASINNISPGSVRNILKNAMSEYPNHIINLPRVISFDEFKADTNNDSIHKKALEVLPERKKSTLYNTLRIVIIGTH